MANEVARLRPRFDEIGVLQRAQRLQRGRDADLALHRQTPHRRQPLTRLELPVADQCRELMDQLLVQRAGRGAAFGHGTSSHSKVVAWLTVGHKGDHNSLVPT